jgi:hypothetical protein
MSNLKDAIGLCLPYGKANSQYGNGVRALDRHSLGVFPTARHGLLQPGIV